MNFNQLTQAAIADHVARDTARQGNFGSARHMLPDGRIVVASSAPVQQNSRGARRGKHDRVSYLVVPAGEKYGKRISKDLAKQLLG